MSRLVALYPAAWRSRYEEEFLALLTERPPSSIGERVDIVRGAVDAHLHPQVPAPERVPDRYGLGPLVGLVLLVGAVLLAANGPLRYDAYGTYRDGGAALPFFVLSLVLLSLGLYRLVGRLPAGSGWTHAAGWIAIVAGPVWAVIPWVMPIGLVFLLGALGLAVGARRAQIVPAWSVILLAVTLAIPAGLFAAMPFLPWYALRVSGLDFFIILAPISGLWLVVGGLLLRGFPEAGPPTQP